MLIVSQCFNISFLSKYEKTPVQCVTYLWDMVVEIAVGSFYVMACNRIETTRFYIGNKNKARNNDEINYFIYFTTITSDNDVNRTHLSKRTASRQTSPKVTFFLFFACVNQGRKTTFCS